MKWQTAFYLNFHVKTHAPLPSLFITHHALENAISRPHLFLSISIAKAYIKQKISGQQDVEVEVEVQTLKLQLQLQLQNTDLGLWIWTLEDEGRRDTNELEVEVW